MKAKILLVDDKPEQIQAFAQVLALEGYETVVAQDDLWAMYLVDEFQPDLIVLDIRFGHDHRKGLDILKQIRAQDKMLPVVMLTGLIEDGLDAQSYDRDADHFISKSASPQSLLALVRRSLRRRESGLEKIDDRLEMDKDGGSARVERNGEWQTLHFEHLECQVLKKLMYNRGQTIPRADLERLFVRSQDPANSLNRCISEIRSKIEIDPRHPEYLITVRSVGYCFQDDRRG